MSNLTIEECDEDIRISEQKIHYLNQVIDGINGFMSADIRENRNKYQFDVYKYQGLLQDCKRIKSKIESYREKLLSNEQ